jgi:rRNA maturation endonuclease Nob1
MAVICSCCGRKLRRKDVEVVKDILVMKGENGLLKEILLAKIAFCKFCGHKLAKRKFEEV